MKKLKFIGCSFLIGQIVTIFYKDKDFREKFRESQGFDKVKTLLNELVDLNKNIFIDIKDHNYEESYQKIKEYVETEKEKLESKVEELASKVWQRNEETLQPLIEDIEERIKHLKETTEENVKNLNEKYALQEKLNNLKAKFEEAKKKTE